VNSAGSSSEALSLLHESPDIAVVVTDIRMPHGTGLELAQSVLRARKGAMATEVILITGHATTDDVTEAVRLGACDFLHKPFRLAEVERAVRKASQRAQACREGALAERENRTSAARLDGRSWPPVPWAVGTPCRTQRAMMTPRRKPNASRLGALSPTRCGPLAGPRRAGRALG